MGDADYLEKHPGSSDGCSAAVALITGNRVVIASLGDVGCVVSMRTADAVEVVKKHAIADDDDEDGEGEEVATVGGNPPPLRWTRAFGDAEYKRPHSAPKLSSTPDVKILHLQHIHRGFAFIC